MRRCNIVSGILLILSIIDFALAAPVFVQEKRQTSIDVVHILKDVITVLGKREDEWLEKFVDDYFKGTEMENSVVPSGVHASSGSAPSELNHGSTNVVQAPALNSASSITNLDPLIELSGPSAAAAPMQGS
jgi:hypothetical protein